MQASSKRALSVLTRGAAWLGFALALSACGGERHAVDPAPSTPQTPGLGGIGLASPVELARAANWAPQVIVPGASFQKHPPFTYNRVTEDNGCAVFAPDWDPANPSGPAGLAWACYVLSTTGITGETSLDCQSFGFWLDPPGAAWVGLGNQVSGAWDWTKLNLDSDVVIRDIEKYRAPADVMVIAVVVLGTESDSLRRLKLGEAWLDYDENEDNDNLLQANELVITGDPGIFVMGNLGFNDELANYDGDYEDWYYFNSTQPQMIEVQVRLMELTYSAEFRISLYREIEPGTLEEEEVTINSLSFTHSFYLDQPGKYYFKISGGDGPDYSGSYAHNYYLALKSSAYALGETEPNNSAVEANPLPPLPVYANPLLGSVGDTSEPQVDQGEIVYDGSAADWFSLPVTQAGPLLLEVTPMFGLIDVEVFDVDGATLLESLTGDGTVQELLTVLPASGTYFICVSLQEGSAHANYLLRAAVTGNDIYYQSTIASGYDPDGLYFGMISLINASGHPAVLYGGNSDFYYSYAEDQWGVKWSAPQGFSGADVDLALVNGKPALCRTPAWGYGESELNYIAATDEFGSDWAEPVVAYGPTTGLTPFDFSMHEIAGNPAIAFCGNGGILCLRATDPNGSTWSSPVEVLSLAGYGVHAELDLQIVNGNPAIVGNTYQIGLEEDAGYLVYKRASDSTGTSWGNPETVLYAGGCVDEFSLAYAGGVPIVAFSAIDNALGLMYVIRTIYAFDADGAAWSNCADLSPLEYNHALDLFGYLGSPALVCYGPVYSYSLRISATGGATWGDPQALLELSDSLNSSSMATSAIELNNQPAVAFADRQGSKVVFISNL